MQSKGGSGLNVLNELWLTIKGNEIGVGVGEFCLDEEDRRGGKESWEGMII